VNRLASDEHGGVLLKIVLVAGILVIGASIAFYWYVGRQRPLELGNVVVGWNPALDDGGVDATGEPPRIDLVPGGRVYVATFVRNGGRFPVTLEGLAEPSGGRSLIYTPVALLRSDGDSTDPELASPFEDVSLGPGEGVGVLVVFAPNAELDCDHLPADEGTSTQAVASVPIRTTSYGIPVTQSVSASRPFLVASTPTMSTCRQVTAQVTDAPG
jgi:hypothetical protein